MSPGLRQDVGARQVVSLAKAREELYLPGSSDPIDVPGGEGSGAMTILRRVRDEAHALAVSCHRGVRSR
eukprot:978733-Rhodomonas_salina.1